jgi:hypothetical protein
LGHHIRLRLEDDRVIAPTADQRRLVARVVLDQSRRYNLLAISLADAHLHGEVVCDRQAAGRLSYGVEASLKQRLSLPVGFVQYDPEPIRDARHLRNTFRYILTQHQRHGLPHLRGRTSDVVHARRAMAAVIGAQLPPRDAA